MNQRLSIAMAVLSLTACSPMPEAAIGTLERERISLPAPVSERITDIPVHEGQTVQAGAVLLLLENERTRARFDAATADVARLQSVLEEARSGPRPERIDEARQRLARAGSLAVNARRERERTESVVARGLLPQAERDRTRTASAAADADVRAARASLAELEHGTRSETLDQAEAALAAARAQATANAVDLERTRITAPRAGVIDSLPFEVGDQVAIGTPLAILLVGEMPHARVYLPQPLRTDVRIGSVVRVFVHGSETAYEGRVRAIRSEPSFTPYYALSGDDAAQLSYLAEVELGADAKDLPIGVPVRAEFPDVATQ